jgi:hypothetical protein
MMLYFSITLLTILQWMMYSSEFKYSDKYYKPEHFVNQIYPPMISNNMWVLDCSMVHGTETNHKCKFQQL